MPRKDITLGSRRSFTKSLAAFGVTGQTLKHLTEHQFEELIGDIEKEVPYIAYWRGTRDENGSPTMEPIYDTWERDRWAIIKGTEKAAAQIRKRIQNQFEIDLISVGSSVSPSGVNTQPRAVTVKLLSYSGDGDQKTSPDVAVEELREFLPDMVTETLSRKDSNRSWEVEDIPVVLEEDERSTWNGCKTYYYNDNYGDLDIPAGAKIKVSKDLADPDAGTFGTPAWDRQRSETVMVSAGHLWKDTGDDGDWAWQPNVSDSDKDGTVYVQVNNENHPDPDYALLSPNDDSYVYEFADDSGGTTGYIAGYVTKDTLQSDIDAETVYYKRGAKTGLEYGKIEHVDTYNKQVETNILGDEGDSGGPFYKLHNGDAYIGGIVNGGYGNSCPDTDMFGTYMEHIVKEEDLHIGGGI